MLEAKPQFELKPALQVISNCQEANYALFLDHCLSLLLTSMQHYLQREQADFKIEHLKKLVELYDDSHCSFMQQTQELLDQLIVAELMEPTFDLGIISKLKIAQRFSQKAQSKWQNYMEDGNLDAAAAHYFHNISSSLINCVDVHMDALRFCESTLLSYKRQMAVEEIEIPMDIVILIEKAIDFLGISKKQNLTIREILVSANLHVSHEGILANLMVALKSYLISPKELRPILD